MDTLAISWMLRGLFFAFIAGAWIYGLRNSRHHWIRWPGFTAALYLGLVPIWQAVESPNAPHTLFSTPLLWAIGAAWGVAGAFMLISLTAIRDATRTPALDAGTRHKLRVITNGEAEGVDAA